MSSNVAYFSTWRPHGNRVSKTWFSNPYYTYQYHKSPEHIRAYQRRKKKKKTRRTQAVARDLSSARPRLSRVTWAARDLGRTLPGPRETWVARCLGRATQATRSPGRHYRQGVLEVLLSFFCFFLSGFLFGYSKNHKVWIFMFFPQIWWLCFGFLKFFFSMYFGLYERLEPLIFFKFC